MPERIIAAAAEDLHGAVDDLHVLVEKVQTKTRRQRLVNLLLAVIVVGLILVAWMTRQESNRRERETDRARYSNCVSHNVEQEGDRNSALNGALVTYGFAESGDLSDAERAEIVAGLPVELQVRYQSFEAQVARDNTFRDCTPEGIQAYINDAPTDPAASD